MILRFAALLTIALCILGGTFFCNVSTPRGPTYEEGVSYEICKMQLAMEQFKAEHRMYPPADLRHPDNARSPIYQFFAASFPNYDIATPRARGATRLEEDLLAEGINYQTFDPAYSLVFWFVGFSTDPQDPLKGHGRRMGWDIDHPHVAIDADLSGAYFEFDRDRLVRGHFFIRQTKGEVDRYYLHVDTNQNGIWDAGERFKTHAAYLYFDADSCYAGLPANDGNGEAIGPGSVLAYDGFQPYRKIPTPAAGAKLPEFGFSKDRRRLDPHYNDDSYQIISAGPDVGLRDVDGDGQLEAVGLGRGGRPSAAGKPFGGEDADNITNFTDGWTIGDFTQPIDNTRPYNPMFTLLLILLAILVVVGGAVIFLRVRRPAIKNSPAAMN